MQSAATVLGVLRERGRRGLPCEELYRQLFNPQLYLLAYGRIYSNKGAMTAGVTPETVDGMSRVKIDRVIDAMRHERYRFRPVRRVHIPKKNGKTRPLGLPTWSDKLVGEVVRLLLEAYHEPTFSDRSHGFRPRRGRHTALREIDNTWTGTAWFIEADIADCFGSLDHDRMVEILSETVNDNRFLRLVRNMLTAGYLEDWTWGATLSGVPQGGVASPILSSIYLHKLDQFVEKTLIPEYTRGARRARNPAYLKLQTQLATARRRGDRTKARTLRQRMVSLPSADPDDPGYRRLRYCRYADDHLLGFAGPKAEAEEIKQRLAQFLRENLKLELSQHKTLITHARTGAAKFLGYEITVQHNDTKKTGRYRRVNGQIALRVPREVIRRSPPRRGRCAARSHRARGFRPRKQSDDEQRHVKDIPCRAEIHAETPRANSANCHQKSKRCRGPLYRSAAPVMRDFRAAPHRGLPIHTGSNRSHISKPRLRSLRKSFNRPYGSNRRLPDRRPRLVAPNRPQVCPILALPTGRALYPGSEAPN